MLLFLWYERESLSLRMRYTEFGWNWPWLSKFKEDFKKDFNVLLLVRYYLPLKKRAWNCIWIIVLICGNWLRLSWEEVENEKFTEEETILEKFYRANQKSEKRWLIGWLIAYEFTFIYFKNISLVDNLSVKSAKLRSYSTWLVRMAPPSLTNEGLHSPYLLMIRNISSKYRSLLKTSQGRRESNL